MTSIYIAPEVEQVRQLHPYVADASFKALAIREQIRLQSQTLLAAHQAGDRRSGFHIMSWWPPARGRMLEDIMESRFSGSDALLTMCREYGFEDVAHLESLDDLAQDADFEMALDCMLNGELAELRALLKRLPHLATSRTRYGHQATLLHYLAANGVESHRQVIPLNAVTMAGLLISCGASRVAEANMYGGEQTPFMLASTSAHPRGAGIADQLNQVLQTG